jgi:hypothetical protein
MLNLKEAVLALELKKLMIHVSQDNRNSEMGASRIATGNW